GHGEALTGAGDRLLAADLEADAAAKDLEALLLRGVDVRGRDEPVRLDVGLDHDGLAAGLVRRLAEDDPLAGHGVLDAVSCTDHVNRSSRRSRVSAAERRPGRLTTAWCRLNPGNQAVACARCASRTALSTP